jgi:Ca-activated chloride channel homolog
MRLKLLFLLLFYCLTLNVYSQTTQQQQAQPAPPQRPVTPAQPPPPPPVPQQPSAPASPQRAAPQQAIIDEDEVIRVDANLVVVPVSVTDLKGQPVLGLKTGDFRLLENGRQQDITDIGDPEQVPLELVLLFDVSGSVDARFPFQKEAASKFLKQVTRPVDKVTVFAIDRTPKLQASRVDSNEAASKVLAIQPAKSPTAFYDTVVEAARFLKSSTPGRHRRVVIAISDGEDTFSDKFKTATAALVEVQRADAVFYSINPSGEALKLNKISTRGQVGMSTIATATGGSAFVPEYTENLEAVFQQIAAELRAQYLLQYYSKSEAASGTFLPIQVSTPRLSGNKIRARQGYYSARR